MLIFSKIDYINLLPFYVHMKKHLKSSQVKAIINYKKSYPSKINIDFKNKRIDAAFISSIKSKKCKCTNIGIVAKQDVMSVLSLNGFFEEDSHSDTSNALSKILKLNGKVLIGDKALRHYYKNDNRDFIDIAKAWREKYNMPFVFARLCFNKNSFLINKLVKSFVSKKVKIPYCVIEKYANHNGLSRKEILFYLSKISYEIGYKEEKSLIKFFKLYKEL